MSSPTVPIPVLLSASPAGPLSIIPSSATAATGSPGTISALEGYSVQQCLLSHQRRDAGNGEERRLSSHKRDVLRGAPWQLTLAPPATGQITPPIDDSL